MIEVNLTEHCNLRCAGCNHSSPHLQTKFMSLTDFKLDFDALLPIIHAYDFRIAGGEPLQHPELLEFLRIPSQSDISDIVTVVTNGVLIPDAPEEMWDLIDRLIVSIYPGITLRMSPNEIKQKANAHGVLCLIKDTPEFMLAVLNHPIKEASLVQTIYDRCDVAHLWGCNTMHEGRLYKCSVAPFLEARLAGRGVQFANREIDGVPLRNNPNLRKDLEDYLSSREPLKACLYCLGTIGKRFPHHQLNNEGLSKELSEDHTDPKSLLQ